MLRQRRSSFRKSPGGARQDDEEQDVAEQHLILRIDVGPELLGDAQGDASHQRAHSEPMPPMTTVSRRRAG